MKTSKNILSEKEMELISLLMQNWLVYFWAPIHVAVSCRLCCLLYCPVQALFPDP